MPSERVDGFQLSPYQKRLWLLQQAADGAACQSQIAALIEGRLERDRLHASLTTVVERHEILRTGFQCPPGMQVPLQVVGPAAIEWAEEHDLRLLNDDECRLRIDALLAADRRRAVDLQEFQPLRASLVCLSSERHLLILSAPALCADRKSLLKLVRETALGCSADSTATAGVTSEPMQYADVAAWHNEVLETATESDRAYWRAQLPASGRRPAALPVERDPLRDATREAGLFVQLLSDEQARGIQALCGQRRWPVDRFFLASWIAFLRRATGAGELVVGTAVDFHAYPELEQALGPLTVHLPLKVQIAGDLPFSGLVDEVSRQVDEISARHEYYTAAETLGVPESHVPGQVAYGFEFVERPECFNAGALSWTVAAEYSAIDSFAASLVCIRTGGALRLELHHARERIAAADIELVAAQYLRVLDSAVADADAAVSRLEILTDTDRQRLLVEFNRTDAAFPSESCVHQRFEEQAARTPDRIAVECGVSVTYADLNRRANQLARHLQARGAGPDVLVPVCFVRSPEMVVGLLAVLKSGAAYVPLDPSDPPERRRAVLQAIDAPVLLTQTTLADRFAGSLPQTVCVDLESNALDQQSAENFDSGARPSNLAYVIHTSGSTGIPKGVMIPHRGLVNYLHWCTSAYQLDAGAGAIVHSSFAFDLTVTSLFAPLLSGGTVFLVAEDEGAGGLASALRRGNYSFIKTTPGQLQMLNQMLAADESAARTNVLICGGEQLHGEDLRPWRSHSPLCTIVNEYGPTETVVGCCAYTVRDAAPAGSVPIGRPIANTQIYVLDRHLSPVPLGVPGQLYVGGACVGRGYFKQPSLTAEQFIPDPFGPPGARLYATGDLARLRPDGELEYLGRSDDQVKIRGYRVELGEVEAALAQSPAIRQAAVVAADEGPSGKRLVGYYVLDSNAPSLDATALRAFLTTRLPDYLVPAAFVRIQAMPLTASGKVDRRALAAVDPDPTGSTGSYVPPRNLDEEVLAGIWAEVLKVDHIGIDDNYFVLGGDSIRSLQVVARARKRGLNFTIDRLFSNPTVRELAASMRTDNATASDMPTTEPFSLVSQADRARMPSDVEDAYPLTMLQGGMLFHRESNPGTSVYHDIFSLHLRARLDVDALRSVIQRLIARHAALRTSFDISSFSEPLQLVHRAAPVPFEHEDIQDQSPEEQNRRIGAWVQADKVRGFDPATFPLVRFHVHVRGSESFQFSGSFHHGIIDGWSDAVMVTEIFEQYFSALNDDATAPLPTASSFREFVALERRAIESAEQQRFWDDALRDAPTAMLSQTRGTTEAASLGRIVKQIAVPLSDEVAAALKKVAIDTTVPLKSVLLAAHMRVLTVLSGQSDAVTCMVSSGRLEHTDGERVLGLFLNSVPFRMNLAGGSWSDLIVETFDAEQRMLPFRRYPLAELKRRRGGQPLADTLFYFTNYHVYQNLQRFDAALLNSSFFEESSFPLVANFRVDPFTSKLFLDLQADQQYVSLEEMERIGGYYQRALGALGAAPDGRYELAPVGAAADAAQGAAWNATALTVDDPGGVHMLVAAQAARTPAAPAVVWGEETWSYATLEARATQVAAYLRGAGLGPEAVVGVCAARGLALVAAVLGVWKAGAAYVPLDPAAPAARVAFQVADAGARVVLTSAAVAARLAAATPGVAWVPLDDPRITAQPATGVAVRVPGAQLAYVIYTSGSTGQPKGVGLEHRQLRNLLAWAETVYPAAERAGVLAGTSLCFDLSLFELWVPLTTGGTVVLAEDALQLATLPARDQVRLVNTVPTVLAALVAQGALPAGVRTVNVAGEPLRPALVAAVLAQHPTVRVLDLYGPTETTTYVTGGPRTATGPETIGRPLANTAIHLLDAHQQPVPVGVVGEVYVGGAGVARGYVGRPAWTAAQFVPDPWSGRPGARLYRTGDLARARPDGQLVFVGRRDGQVKLRGYRIELGEIDAVLTACPGVREAVAVVRDRAAAGPQLVAYVAGAPALDPRTLRTHLAAHLPAYMVPAELVVLDALPRTPTGKLDRRALPDPAGQPADTPHLPPQTDVEALLARIWEEVLGVRAVGRDDNFFELGGDSILSIQIVARANQAGIGLTVQQIFQHQTIASLAEVAERADANRPEQGPVSGPVPLTPIQRWLLESDLPNPHHWNQTVFLEARETIDAGLLRTVVERLLLHHDALRLRFLRSDHGWQQVNAPPDAAVPFERIDLSRVPQHEQANRMETVAAECQATLNISDGPMLRVVLFELGAGAPSHVLIVVHHLAVDGISWRILLGDIDHAYRSLAEGGDAGLPAKTSSFKDWAHSLVEYAQSETLRRQLATWEAVANLDPPGLPVDHGAGRGENTEGSVQVLSVTLTPEETRDLLQHVPAAYRTQINDALLAALAQTLARWTGDDTFIVDVEGHGRELVAEGLDLSRTVGWFTSIFPVVLECRPQSPPGAVLKSVKERLRGIPHHGMGYGVLHYLSHDPATEALRGLPARQLSFNYLGQFQQVLPASIFRLSNHSTGPSHDPAGVRRYLLDVRAAVYDDRLRIDWSYSRHIHRPETIDRLARWYVESLRDIITHCCSTDAGGCTPSDFPLAQLDQRGLDQLVGQARDIDDIYPVAPIQAGMLFHAVASADSTAYCVQVGCTLHGPLDVEALERAWQHAIRRHPALRTAFPGASAGDGLQVVHRDAPFEIHIDDLRRLPDTDRALGVQAFLDEERQRAFDLAKPPLFRLTLFRTGEDRHECAWTYHHLILDGWSAYLVLEEVFAAYGALCAGDSVRLAHGRPFADYIAWLQERDAHAAEMFWRQALDGFVKPPPIDFGGALGGNPTPASGHSREGYGEQRLVLSAADTRALDGVARQQRLTVSTLIQGAWAVVLGHYTGAKDVLFGTTVTGRPPEIRYVESMIGVFINTVPVRVQLRPEQPLGAWLVSLQAQQAERSPHEHASLTQIQRWSGLSAGTALFESFIVFENFPAAFSLNQQHRGLAISDVRFRIDENYPLVVVVDPGAQLAIQIKYDRSRFEESSVAAALRGLDLILRTFIDPQVVLGQIAHELTRFLSKERLRGYQARQETNVRKLQDVRGKASRVSFESSGS